MCWSIVLYIVQDMSVLQTPRPRLETTKKHIVFEKFINLFFR